MHPDLIPPPRPAPRLGQGQATTIVLGLRHQPWLHDAVSLPVPDDFSRLSLTHPLRGVALGLLLAFVVLAMGRSAQIVDALYGLDTFPGTETLIALAEAWHEAMSWLGVPDALAALRGLLGFSAE